MSTYKYLRLTDFFFGDLGWMIGTSFVSGLTSLVSGLSSVSILRPLFGSGFAATVGADFDLEIVSASSFAWLGFEAPCLSSVNPLASSFCLLLSATSISIKISLNIIIKRVKRKLYSLIKVTKNV